MHATLTAPRPSDAGPAPLLRRLLADAGGSPVLELCLWPDAPPADAAADQIWAVSRHLLGRAAGRTPVAAQLVRFCGPRDAAAVAASRRAGTERIWPAVRVLEGLVDVVALERPDGEELVVSFATSVEHFALAGERIMATSLLPGEDPALLPGPDRIEVLHVVAATSSVTVTA